MYILRSHAAVRLSVLGSGVALLALIAATPAMASTGSAEATASVADLAADVASKDAAASETESFGDEITVSGIRSSLNSALNVKRNAATVVDAISAEDIGHYPDVNIAESVQRISGVQINRTRGEGQSVNIRGLPAIFTLSTLNGRSVPNALLNTDATATRAFDFTILASEFVNALEVYKAPTADLEEGGLSGTVNVRTPRAMEIGKRVLTGSILGEYEGNSGKISPRASFLFADVVADGRLGLTFGLSYSKRRPETHAASAGYNYQTEGAGLASGTGAADLNGDGVIQPGLGVRIPGTAIYNLYTEERERISGIGAVEFKVNDELTLFAEGLYSKLNVEALRNERISFLSNSSGLIASGTQSEVFDGYPTTTRLELSRFDQRANGRLEDRSGDLATVSAGARWQADAWQVDLVGSHSKSKQVLSNLALATNAIGAGYYSTAVGEAIHSVGYLGNFASAINDVNSYRVLSINGEFLRRSSDTLSDGRLDIARSFGDEGITRVAFGLRYAKRAQFQDNGRLSILPAGVSALYGGLPAGATPGSYSAAPVMTLIQAGKGSFLDTYSGNAVFPREFLVSDPRGIIQGHTSAQLIAAGAYTNDPTGITDVKEDTLAGYGRADFRFGRLSGNVGLRVVNTRQVSTGVSPDLTRISLLLEAGAVTRVPTAAPLTVKRTYTDFLPSLNLRYEATDKLQLRFGLSRTMARPNLADIAPTTTANGLSMTITQKNPYLDPYRANNVDLTAEWYFTQGGVLGASAFYKRLDSLISNDAKIETLPVQVIAADGSTSVANLGFTVNGLVNGEGVTVKGVEVFFQQAFTFLPAPFDGLGAAANYTFIDNSDPLRLTAASRHNFNATAYYEKGPVGVRLSYSWRGSFLSSAPQGPTMGSEIKAFGTLDGSATLRLNSWASLALEGVNLLDAAQKGSFLSGLPNSYSDSGRRVLFGARLAF